MVTVRTAVPDDAPELVRLRQLMFESMQTGMQTGMQPGARPGSVAAGDASSDWRATAEDLLHKVIADPGSNFGIFVVDDPAHPGRLASCAVGTLEQRLPAPGHPDGLFGFVFNICTDPGSRRQGCARACTEALIDWFDARGATRVDLHASADGQQLYRQLGFTEHSVPLSRTRRR